MSSTDILNFLWISVLSVVRSDKYFFANCSITENNLSELLYKTMKLRNFNSTHKNTIYVTCFSISFFLDNKIIIRNNNNNITTYNKFTDITLSLYRVEKSLWDITTSVEEPTYTSIFMVYDLPEVEKNMRW